MKLEILHDALAQHVYDKASTEDKMRLKVDAFVRSRYAAYQERGGLLSGQDLNYIQPYLDELDFERGIRRFIQRSRWRSRWRMLTVALLVVIAFVTLALYTIRSQQLIEVKERNSATLQKSLDRASRLNALYEREKARREEVEEQAEDVRALLRYSKDDLANMAHQLEVTNKELEATNKELQDANALLEEKNKRIEQEKNEVKSDYDRVKKIQEQQEQKLSQAGQRQEKLLTEYIAAESRGALAGGDEALAFRLARAAIERDPNNEEAQQVLFHLEKPSSSYPYKGLPPNHSSPEEIIRKLKSRYGSLSPSQKRKFGLSN